MSEPSWLSASRIALIVAVVLLLVVLGPILSAPDPEPPASERPAPALHPWDLIGCWELRYAGWGDVDAPLADRSAGPEGAPGGALSPPGAVMLLPDSVDAWGRLLPSYRAVQLDGSGRRGRALRWLVDADTLWLLWSEDGARAGAALRSSGDSLIGSVRATQAAGDRDSVDVSARAAALPVNCVTRRPEPVNDRPRR